MASATLTFDLSCPDDRREFDEAVQAGAMKSALWDVAMMLREWDRGHDEDIRKMRKRRIVETLRERFHEILDENGVRYE